MLRVSYGELLAQLKQSFEALGYNLGEYDSAATCVLSLELWGFGGLGLLEAALPSLELHKQWAPAVTYESNALILDCFQGSALFGLIPSIELIYVKARQHGLSRATLVNCTEPEFVLPLLMQVCQRGYCASVRWPSADDPESLRWVVLEGDVTGVRVDSKIWQASEPLDETLCIEVAKSGFDFSPDHSSSEFPGLSLQGHWGNAELQALFEERYMSSVTIDPWLWGRLQDLGRQVLVSATEKSRSGAGAE
jgi:hypothetical protein|tara:strand:- start:61 stop:810 length:750 start_codon:yes stop_codon:yes gene_type:complete